MRRIAAEQAALHADTREGKREVEGERYVEGESDDEDGVPIEVDEEGEVEDVDMRANGISEDDE